MDPLHHSSLDKASLHLRNNDLDHVLDIWAQSEECYSCSPWKYVSMKPGEAATLHVNSTYATNFFVRSPPEAQNLYSYQYHFIQNGIYSVQCNISSCSSIITEHRGDNEYKAIFSSFIFFSFLYLFWVGMKSLQRRMEEEPSTVTRNGVVIHNTRTTRAMEPEPRSQESLEEPELSKSYSVEPVLEPQQKYTLAPVPEPEPNLFQASPTALRNINLLCQDNSGSYGNLLNDESSSPESEREAESPVAEGPTLPDSSSVSTRLRSLDTFRGIAITMMIFVNYGGGKYYFFKHSPWNGLTVADLVFPWFLWIMGVSLSFSIKSQLRRSVPYKIIVFRIVKRFLMLFLLGLISMNHHSNFLPELRICGVLQRIAICYLFSALLETLRMRREEPPEFFSALWLKDILWSWVQWLVIVGILIVYTAITFALPVPGCPTGYIGPGGAHAGGKYPNCTGGAYRYIDRLIFGEDHMYGHPTCRVIYDSFIPFDPEGVLGTATSLLTVQLGVATGRIILNFPSHSQRIKRWIIWGLILGLIGGLLCNWSKEGGVIPLNKNLWSLSYVCVTASFASFFFSLLYFWIDDRKGWNGTILRIAGMNAILLYLGHEFTRSLFPWSWKPVPPHHTDHLVMNLWGTSLWLIIAYVCHEKKLYISL